MFWNKKFDFVAIGDITTDAFIRLKDAEVHCDIDKENCKLSVKFGDKIPYESVEEVVAVGNSANAAVSALRLGLSSALMADLGEDRNGHNCFEALKKQGVSTSLITWHKGFNTNYHYVLWYGDDRTILVKHSEFPYKMPKMANPKWLYLSSLASNSEAYHNEIAEYVQRNPKVKLVFQPGTFQIKLGSYKLKGIYKRTEIFFCNIEEAKIILNMHEGGKNKEEVLKLATEMTKLGPKLVILTDGANGAYAYDAREGKNDLFFMRPYPDPKPPVDRTGAGDAFASTFTSAIILGKSVEEALRWAPINSMSVVQYVGAQKGLLTCTQLMELLAKAPGDYKPERI